LGLTDEEYGAVIPYLSHQGWISLTQEWNARITLPGIAEAEREMTLETKQNSDPRIPPQVIGEVTSIFGEAYTHDHLTTLFLRVGVPEEDSEGPKTARIRRWLKQLDTDGERDAHAVLGRFLQRYMEQERPFVIADDPELLKQWNAPRDRIRTALAASGLSYHPGGQILGGVSLPPQSQSLADLIRARDLTAIKKEFDRASSEIEKNPDGAATAACAILEATCHTYIAEEELTPPDDKSLQPLWKKVQGHLGIAPTPLLRDDLQRVLRGLASVVDGVGAFRTHAGDAHGRGPDAPSIEPRHARLVVGAAYSVVMFVLETWAARNK
jgi:hypothetical protein